MTEAEKRYSEIEKTINEQIKKLQVKLEQEKAEFMKNPSNWGYVGNLGHIKEVLGELV